MKELTLPLNHTSQFDTDKVIDFFSKKDDVPFIYVCTTTLNDGKYPADVFYRQTPHPKFGNKYLGVFMADQKTYVCNADCVEHYVFGMVKDENNVLNYSTYRYDYKSFSNGNMIDGGRDYTRFAGDITYVVVRDGNFFEYEEENELQQ